MHAFIVFSLIALVTARPAERVRRQDVAQQNRQDAINLNNQFQGLNANSPCQPGQTACINNGFAQCSNGRFALLGCAQGTVCSALPLVNSPGTSIACTTTEDRDRRLGGGNGQGGGNNGGNGNNNGNNQTPPPPPTPPAPAPAPPPPPPNVPEGNNNGGDSQTSLTLDPALRVKEFEDDGQSQPNPGQVRSLTSSNNFINFCSTVPFPLTTGAQLVDGSCNPAPMGVIAAKSKMPASKFLFPTNGGTVAAGTAFTVLMAIRNLETGFFVNAAQKYYAAPQQVNAQGFIQGHSHLTIQKLNSLDQTEIVDPEVFAFFKGFNAVAENGVLSAEVTDGLAPGFYRMTSINTASNHQPALVAVAQRGALDDTVYFTVQ